MVITQDDVPDKIKLEVDSSFYRLTPFHCVVCVCFLVLFYLQVARLWWLCVTNWRLHRVVALRCVVMIEAALLSLSWWLLLVVYFYCPGQDPETPESRSQLKYRNSRERYLKQEDQCNSKLRNYHHAPQAPWYDTSTYLCELGTYILLQLRSCDVSTAMVEGGREEKETMEWMLSLI